MIQHHLALSVEVRNLLNNGAPLVISISGGKDSDAMTYTLLGMHRQHGWRGDIHLVHADLGRMEWSQTARYVEAQAQKLGLPLHIVRHSKGDLLDGIHRRMAKRADAPPFPSSAARWCTSDYKRATISRWIRQTFPENHTIICAMALRAEESPARSKREVFALRPDACAPSKNRVVYDWLPLHHFTLVDVWRTIGYTLDELKTIQADCQRVLQSGDDVFAYIQQIGFKAHPAYALGNHRLSCALCVLADQNDLRNGAQYQADLYRHLVDVEIESGFSFRNGLWLADLRPDLLTSAQQQAIQEVKAKHPKSKPATKSLQPHQLQLF